jgi:hypothetical protein
MKRAKNMVLITNTMQKIFHFQCMTQKTKISPLVISDNTQLTDSTFNNKKALIQNGRFHFSSSWILLVLTMFFTLEFKDMLI